MPRKFGFDNEKRTFLADCYRADDKGEALERSQKPELEEEFLLQEFEYVATMDLSEDELADISRENKLSSDYRSKKFLIDLAAKVMAKLGLEKRLTRDCIINYGLGNVLAENTQEVRH